MPILIPKLPMVLNTDLIPMVKKSPSNNLMHFAIPVLVRLLKLTVRNINW